MKAFLSATKDPPVSKLTISVLSKLSLPETTIVFPSINIESKPTARYRWRGIPDNFVPKASMDPSETNKSISRLSKRLLNLRMHNLCWFSVLEIVEKAPYLIRTIFILLRAFKWLNVTFAEAIDCNFSAFVGFGWRVFELGSKDYCKSSGKIF